MCACTLAACNENFILEISFIFFFFEFFGNKTHLVLVSNLG